METQRIRHRILVPLGFVLLSLIGAALFGFYNFASKHLDEETGHKIEYVKDVFESVLNHDATLMQGLIGFIEKDNCIRNAWQVKDREGLLRCASPVFDDIRAKYQVTHFYFHSLDQVNFLRVHNPPRFGDHIGRFTMEGAIKTGETVHGIELGPFGTFTLRVVQPWRVDGELVGYIELGQEIEHITLEMGKILNVALVLLIDKERLDQVRWEEGQRMMRRKGNWNQLPEAVVIDYTHGFNIATLNEQFSAVLKSQFATAFVITLPPSTYKGGVLPLIDAGGQVVGKLVVLNDITQRLAYATQLSFQLLGLFILTSSLLYLFLWIFLGRIERKLIVIQQEAARLLAILEMTSDLVLLSDSKGKVLYINKAGQEMVGIDAKELPHTKISDIQPAWASDLVLREGIPTAIQEGVWHGKTALINTEEHELPVSQLVIVHKGKENEIEFISTIMRDMSEVVKKEAQLQHAQKLESVGRLAAGIAHEINTPTQFVSDNTRFLSEAFEDLGQFIKARNHLLEAAEKDAISAEQLNKVKEIAEEIDLDYLLEEIPKAISQSQDGLKRISKIVRAMKEFSHPGTEEKTPIDINLAIQSTIDVSRNEWKYHANMVTDLDPDLPLVPCIPGEFNQVILNTIVNGAHAIADAAGDDPEQMGAITICTCQEDDWVKITISDTGMGIPESIRDRIFDPFFTTKEVGKGTGQGLAIVYSAVVDKHSGRLDVESEVGKGAAFIIRLPLHSKT